MRELMVSTRLEFQQAGLIGDRGNFLLENFTPAEPSEGEIVKDWYIGLRTHDDLQGCGCV